MPSLKRGASLFLLAASVLLTRALAQNPPALMVSPGLATLLVGGRQTFRAVGKDGRIRHNIHWSISPAYAATLTTNDDEVTVEAKEGSARAVLTATADGDSADA